MEKKLLKNLGIVFLILYLIVISNCFLFDSCEFNMPPMIIYFGWIIGFIFVFLYFCEEKGLKKSILIILGGAGIFILSIIIEKAIIKNYLYERLRFGVIVSAIILIYLFEKMN